MFIMQYRSKFKNMIVLLSFICLLFAFLPAYTFWTILKFTNTWSSNWSQKISVMTWRYYCDNYVDVVAVHTNNWNFTNCHFNLYVNTWSLTFVGKWPFNTTVYNDWDPNTGLYWLRIAIDDKQTPKTTTTYCARLKLVQDKALTWTVLEFKDKNWNDFSINWWTEDYLTLASNWSDTLTWVNNLRFNYEACPCTLDWEAPKIYNTNSLKYKNWAKITWEQTIKFLIYDQWWENVTHWFNGQPYSVTWLNYVSVWWNTVDNQEWIDSNTISVKVSYNGWQALTPSNLSITPYEGWTYWSAETWDSHNRWYWIEFTTNSLEVEKPVVITISWSDNKISWTSVCNTTQHSTWITITMNTGAGPGVSLTSPSYNSQNNVLNPFLSFEFTDDWAWVNSGTISITIKDIYSWWIKIYTWETFDRNRISWSLQRISWTDGTGWRVWYTLTIKPTRPFPADTKITLTWSVTDFVGKTTVNPDMTFYTRKNCIEYLWCYNPLDISVWSGSEGWVSKLQNLYTWTKVVVTWTIAPYPYLTWDSGNVLMCGPIETTINLEWIVIYDNAWNVISTETWYVYSQDSLYVTWLDYGYEWKDDNNENYWLVTIRNNN